MVKTDKDLEYAMVNNLIKITKNVDGFEVVVSSGVVSLLDCYKMIGALKKEFIDNTPVTSKKETSYAN